MRVSLARVDEIDALLAEGKADEALVLAERLVGSHPTSVKAWTALVRAHDAANEDLAELFERLPESPLSLQRLRKRMAPRRVSLATLDEVETLISADRLEDAADLAEIVTTSHPDSVRAWRVRFALCDDPVHLAEIVVASETVISAVRTELRAAINDDGETGRVVELAVALVVLEFDSRELVRRADRFVWARSVAAHRHFVDRLVAVDAMATQHLGEVV